MAVLPAQTKQIILTSHYVVFHISEDGSEIELKHCTSSCSNLVSRNVGRAKERAGGWESDNCQCLSHLYITKNAFTSTDRVFFYSRVKRILQDRVQTKNYLYRECRVTEQRNVAPYVYAISLSAIS